LAFTWREGVQGDTDGFPQTRDGWRGCRAQERLELGERHFDRVEVRRVGRQIQPRRTITSMARRWPAKPITAMAIRKRPSKIDIKVPRDREGTFDPKLIQRYQHRFPGFDEKIVSIYAPGMTVREIQGHLLDLYGLEVSPDLVSTITDAVLETVAEWQNRPLEAMYPLIFFDALRVKIRDEGLVRNKAVYVALGVTADGTKDILGLWIETSEGAKFWLRVMNELRTRGVGDILIAVVDGLKGFPEAINAVFPQTIVQTCIVHLNRNSMDFASWKDRKAIAAALKTVYRAKDADAGRQALDEFDAGPWGKKYPAIAQSWRRHWEQVIPFFAFPIAVRRIKIDKRFVFSRAIFFWRGRPRGEERSLGWKLRQAA